MSREDRHDDTEGMTPWSAPAVPSSADRVVLAGRYEILGLIGSGGMGTVYRAFDRELEETVALKTLREGLGQTPHLLERFKREVKLARRVTHPNVARTFDIGEHGAEKFLTMEYIEGESLSSVIAREGALPVARVAALGCSVCAGLGAAHAVGVVHRDLKPDNVLIEKSGRVVITDFGIACAHEDPAQAVKTLGGVVGTPAYMAPEQVEAAPDVDARADIYALGVMLFEMLSGQMPFSGQTPYAVAAARLSRPAPDLRSISPAVSERIARVVARCLARERADRYAHAAEIAAELGAHAPTLDAGPSSLPSRPPEVWQPPEPDADTKAGEKTVAVLPFRNAGPPEDAYVAEGLTEDLIDTLSMTPGLKVRPQSAVVAHRQPSQDAREIGRALGVEVVVDGSVRRSGDMLRIAARMIGVRDGFQLWAKRFDRPHADVLVVSDEAARAIAEALSVDAIGQARAAPSDASAIDLYLRGRSELRKIWREPVRRAVELLEQAHARAPNDPMLLAAFARARSRLWYYDGGVNEGRAARDLAERALAAAPDRGESWLALAAVRLVEQDVEAAARLLKEALSRSPQLAEAHELLGEILLEVADIDDAIKSLRTALALDPGLRSRFLLARAAALSGRWSEVEALLSAPNEDEQSARSELAVTARLALWNEALRERAKKLIPPASADDQLPTNYASGVLDTALRGEIGPETRAFMAAQLGQRHQAPRFAGFKHLLAAEVYAHAGEIEPALAEIEASIALGCVDKNWLELCPVLAKVRQLPAYAELHTRMTDAAARVRAVLERG